MASLKRLANGLTTGLLFVTLGYVSLGYMAETVEAAKPPPMGKQFKQAAKPPKKTFIKKSFNQSAHGKPVSSRYKAKYRKPTPKQVYKGNKNYLKQLKSNLARNKVKYEPKPTLKLEPGKGWKYKRDVHQSSFQLQQNKVKKQEFIKHQIARTAHRLKNMAPKIKRLDQLQGKAKGSFNNVNK